LRSKDYKPFSRIKILLNGFFKSKQMKSFLKILVCGFLMKCTTVFAQQKQNSRNAYEVAVYYFPQWHVDAQNEKTHGYSWTEWESLKTAKPRVAGHQQPKVR